ncbi:hypothetical protein [Clostridium lundense]|uniref:hypothetical protein n=1 Tax=Clostridium lundense TaxID=319475 RepID=UPI0004824F21|nr:hypothetical protein [Clostridium lundense]
MALFKKITLAICLGLLIITTSSCSKGKSKISDSEKSINIPNYPNTIVMENKDTKLNIYKTDKEAIAKLDSLDYVSDIEYNNKNSIYTFVTYNQEELGKNNIKVISKNGGKVINDFYFAKDLKLSSQGSKLAYRTFKSQSLDSAQGLSLYDIEKGKKVDLKSQVLISGSLYSWINDEEIIYYGIYSGNGKSTGIFKYNIKDHKEEMYLDNIQGYCTYFMYLNNNMLIFSKNIEENKLYLYNKQNNESVDFSVNIENVYDGVFDKNNNLIYIIASDKNTGITILYKIDLNTLKIERINYDFPQMVDSEGGLHVDSEGLLYYCGFTNLEENNDKNEVFMYNPKDNSNNLISINPSRYKVNGSN